MSGTVWMFSDQIDDEDIDFMHRESSDTVIFTGRCCNA